LKTLQAYFGNKRIKAISHADIEQFKRERLETPPARLTAKREKLESKILALQNKRPRKGFDHATEIAQLWETRVWQAAISSPRKGAPGSAISGCGCVAICVLVAMQILLANSKVNRFNTTEGAYAMRCRLVIVDSSMEIIPSSIYIQRGRLTPRAGLPRSGRRKKRDG